MFKNLSYFMQILGIPAKKRHFSSLSSPLLRAPYSNEDRTYILKKINERDLPSKEIGQNNANRIISYLEKNKINSLEDLLEVIGIGPRLLKRICDKILDARDGVEPSAPVVRKKRATQLILPPLDDSKKKSLLNVVGVHIGYTSVSWALMNTVSKNLIDWNIVKNTNETENLISSLQLVERVSREIPEGDLYLFEETGTGRSKPDIVRSYHIAMFISALQALRGNPSESPVVALAKPRLKDQLFQGSVGSERVSIQHHAVNLIEERSPVSCVSVSKELSSCYYGLEPHAREEMAHSLLLVTAFVKVILNKQTEAIE